MNVNKTKVFSTFDTHHETWNIMDMDNQCLFFGTIDELEAWLDSNSDKYEEEQLH